MELPWMEDSGMDGGLMGNQLNDLGLSWAEIEEQCQIHLDTEDPESRRLYLRGTSSSPTSDALYLGKEGFCLVCSLQEEGLAFKL